MPAPPTFSLLDHAWIPVVDREGVSSEVSLRELFSRAHDLTAVEAEIATMSFALYRLVLAVLYRVAARQRDEPRDVWERWWQARELPRDIQTYLDEFSGRFDLFDPTTPFYQVAGLHTATNEVSTLERLIPDVPNGEQFFAVRAAQSLRSISFAEAARYLVHAQAFDVSGIKSGAVGDPRVKGGKGYPIGVSWAGNLGGLLLEGDTLKETLLLNLCLENPKISHEWWSTDGDRVPWERPPQSAGEEWPGAKTGDVPGRPPTGPAQLLTQQSRRIRLVHNGDAVSGVVLANGDQLWPQNRYFSEPMTGWRFSDPQTKKYGLPVLMPREHDPARSLWRGLESVLPLAESLTTSSEGEKGRPAATVNWLRILRYNEFLDPDRIVRTRAIGMSYGSQSSVVEDVYDDAVVTHAALFDSRPLQEVAVAAVRCAEDAVRAVGDLARDLAVAAGGEGTPQRDRAREGAFSRLDEKYRTWLLALTTGTDTDDALIAWSREVEKVLEQQADELIETAGPSAWRGRDDSRGHHVDVGSAERRFHFALRTVLPRNVIDDESEES